MSKTGFFNFFPNRPQEVRYSYHGVPDKCLIQPTPGAYAQYPTEIEYGPKQFMDFQGYYCVGWYRQEKWSYDLARDAFIANTYGNNVGQKYSSGTQTYTVYRYSVSFDTSGAPDNAKWERAFLHLKGLYIGTNKIFDIVIQNGMPVYPHIPAQLSDYWRGNWGGNGGSVTIPYQSYKIIQLNATGLGWINKYGITKFVLRSSRDINGNPPTLTELVSYSSSTGVNWLRTEYRLPL